MAFDLESFGWGLLVGGVITIAAEVAIVALTWPYIAPEIVKIFGGH